MSQPVKILGDTISGITEQKGVSQQQRGGLGKLSYGLAKISQYGLAKISQYGLAKISQYDGKDLTFEGKFPQSFQKKAREGGRVSPRVRARNMRIAKARKRLGFGTQQNSGLSGADHYGNTRQGWRTANIGYLGNVKGLTKSAQPAGGIAKVRTRVRTGKVAKTREQFLKSSYQRPRFPNLLKIFKI